MQFKRLDGVLMLSLSPDFCISFRESWIESLSKLHYDKFGEYIRSEIYPELVDSDKKIWNRSTISNKDLQEAIEVFKKG